MIREEERGARILSLYKKDSSFPFDFYNTAFRESDSAVSALRELCQRVSGRDLPMERDGNSICLNMNQKV